jgi:hypothetical protein
MAGFVHGEIGIVKERHPPAGKHRAIKDERDEERGADQPGCRDGLPALRFANRVHVQPRRRGERGSS